MCIGFCFETALCCAGYACCACLCAPAKALGAAPKTFARIGYVVFQMCIVIGTIISMYVMHWILSWSSWVVECPAVNGGNNYCVGPSLLVRMSFALALCHTICFCICCVRNEMAAKFNEGCWCFKMLIVVAMMVGGLWIPNERFYYGYLHFA